MPASANCPKNPCDARADVGIRAPILPLSQQPFRPFIGLGLFVITTLLPLVAMAQFTGGPPVINKQPQSQIVAAGTDVTFRVDAAPSYTPVRYQWRYLSQNYAADLAGETNSVLVISNATLRAAGGYAVVVANAAGSITSDTATLTVAQASANPPSVSLGASVTLRATIGGSLSRGFQWRFGGANIPGATNGSLVLTNVQLANAGTYFVAATTDAASVTVSTSVSVDPQFTKITDGIIVNDPIYGGGAAWGDYDNDGNIDLFVNNASAFVNNPATIPNRLYHNNGNVTFTRIETGRIATDPGTPFGGFWGDYDNDGLLDLFVTTTDRNYLYHNRGNGTFERILTGRIATDVGDSRGAAWGDYDNDGFLDLFVPHGGDRVRALYRNNGDGTFDRVQAGRLTSDSSYSVGSSWVDYNNDGLIDLFVVNGTPGPNFLYRNDGNGVFTKITSGAIVTDVATFSVGCVWGDYDNDGFPDVFVANEHSANNFLYHNNGDGTFQKVTTGVIIADARGSWDCAWGDYDNDGYLDLFVANTESSLNFLFHNKQDGTFEKITTGSPANDQSSGSCVWGDYDNDGFLDLFAANGAGESAQSLRRSYLYHNNGNNNAWLKLKLAGTQSNRAAIGAKVRVKATIWGQTFWQLRDVSGGSGYRSQNDLRPNFGLGDATNINTVRIEWPSGIVQEMQNVAVKQFLTVTESVLTVEPKAQDFVGGADFIFNVSTNSTASTNYQWRFNATDLAGETNAVLTVRSVGVSSAGKYTVVVTLPNGDTVESTAAFLNRPVPPAITAQPQSQTVDPGGTATFQVSATGSPPLLYQWRLNESPIDGATDATLTVTNVQPENAGDYTVEVRNLSGAVTSTNATLGLVGAASIYAHPRDQSVSLGANVAFSVSASGTPPFTYQWRLNGADIAGATKGTLNITNVALANNGQRYNAIVRNALGSASSREALLTVDPTFTKITDSPIVNASGYGSYWGDYDDDGNIDLYVSSPIQPANFLFRNNGEGSFTRITSGNAIVDERGTTATFEPVGGSWVDYDNDGRLDLLVGNSLNGSVPLKQNLLYHNEGNGVFTKITSSPLSTGIVRSFAPAWGDYDNDGNLDVFLINNGGRNLLYRNQGNGIFEKITAGAVVNEVLTTAGIAWGDYDNDGDLDLVIAVFDGGKNYLYQNNGDGTFTRLNPFVLPSASSIGCNWADYDNDGDLDVIINGYNGKSALFRNNGDGSFTRVLEGPLVNDAGSDSQGFGFGDYDNDGWQDVFVANSPRRDYLYHNNGDGTFTRVTTGSIANDPVGSFAGAWGDYNNDGFLDLTITRHTAKSALYLNNGNANNWIKFKLVGTLSNRGAIGAKVRVQATLGGKTFWQLRELSGGSGWEAQNDVRPIFGLGDATVADTVRIEWPSGIVQEMHNLAVKQFLPVTEPVVTITPKIQELVVGSDLTFTVSNNLSGPLIYQWRFNGTNIVGQTNATLVVSNAQEANLGKYSVALTNPVSGDFVISAPALLVETPRLTGLARQADGSVHLNLIGMAGQLFRVETSSNLFNWTPLVTITNGVRTEIIVETNAANFPQRFYRALVP